MAADVSMISVIFLETWSSYQFWLLIWLHPFFPHWRGVRFLPITLFYITYIKTWESCLYFISSHPISLLNPLESDFHAHPSIKSAIVKVTNNLHIAKYSSQFRSSVYLINTVLIKLSFLRHLFYLASRTPISVLLLHHWQFHCRLFLIYADL